MVWLPPGYDSDTTKRYPVLYMHDGGTVMVEWRLDELAKPLIAAGQIEPLIIVFIPHGGTLQDRFDEYSPTRPSNSPGGGKADLYGQLLVEELKPFIDSFIGRLQTAPTRHLAVFHSGGPSLFILVSSIRPCSVN